uniref:Thiol:disulfide interchange protein n=1 Tax=Kuetzingia canaliculata TaxID=228262 RepID=A0A1Z1MPL8_KUECA|nr:thiol:disulfide interchange protein [Kuetzingia canaliculata]ARW67792.1 thiol:disulfide interchange protein [Kuetzingia canaliculata]
MLSFFIERHFFDKYQVLIYTLQHNLYKILSLKNSTSDFSSIFIFFFLGITTILTPCLISVIPLILSYLNSEDSYKIHRSLFIVGLMSSLIFVIFFGHLLNISLLIRNLPILSYIIFILISLNLMRILDLSFFLNFIYSIFSFIRQDDLNTKSYFMGLLIGISSMPCNTSIIFLVTTWLGNISNNLLLLLYLSCYLSGCFLPLIIILNGGFNYKNNSIFSSMWNLLISLSGSFMFILSFLSLLRIFFA